MTQLGAGLDTVLVEGNGEQLIHMGPGAEEDISGCAGGLLVSDWKAANTGKLGSLVT